ncbi:cytochrome P450 [Mollisia scopiformis]|uniref:Cytochrome P450 n=1 Tax=Mollisia scopiformis TaxID=149040 RepID=A0A194WY32_MOLSC|nr:cytochrome P450 [Mollisia scopiformis]KUJ12594.1 cytochrome P450 [Mollisia scopiformis]
MEILTALLLSWPYIVGSATVYFTTLIFYRLFLHPLAKFPGPKVAAITRYYEAYYDIVQNGQYIFRIQELHKKYGPIIRISPYELHILDSAFYEKLYCQEGRWEKYSWAYDAFGVKDSIISTANHELHKARRQPLDAYFSKTKVANQQALILRNLEKLCSRLSKVSGSRKPINLGAALSAFTRDVSTEFMIGKSYNDLDHEDFNIALTNMTTTGFGFIWRMTKHITWFGPAMKAIPFDWAMKLSNDDTKAFLSMLRTSEQDTKELMAAATSPSPDEKAQRTIVHEIMDSSLPTSDKSFERVAGDVATVTSAGFETTSSALRLIIYHVFSKPDILQRLRTELATLGSADKFEWRRLEQLSYLTSVLMEGLRMSPGVVSRLARIAPDRDIMYKEWVIPAGTPVGMSVLTLHMDKTLYPDPRHFDPDRWMDLEVRKRADKVFAPFSKGTRMCIGMYLAWAEMYLVLATLVQQFNFEFEGASAKDFVCSSDEFSPGTSSLAVLKVFVTPYEG